VEKISSTPIEYGLYLSFSKDLMMRSDARMFGRQLLLNSTVSNPCFGAERMVVSRILFDLNSVFVECRFTLVFTSNSSFCVKIDLMIVEEEVGSMIDKYSSTDVL
jgi:hypothetical protein